MDLSKLDDEDLASLKNADISMVLTILFTRYKNYGYSIIYQKLNKANCISFLYEEKDGFILDALYDSTKSFDKTKGCFRTYFSSVLSNKVINRIREFKSDAISEALSLDNEVKNNNEVRFSDCISNLPSNTPTPKEVFDINENEKLVEQVFKLNKKRKIRIIKMKQLGFTNREIIKRCGCSTRTINSLIEKVQKKYLESKKV